MDHTFPNLTQLYLVLLETELSQVGKSHVSVGWALHGPLHPIENLRLYLHNIPISKRFPFCHQTMYSRTDGLFYG